MRFATLARADTQRLDQHDTTWSAFCALLGEYAAGNVGNGTAGKPCLKPELASFIPADTPARGNDQVRSITMLVIDADNVDGPQFASRVAWLASQGIAHCAYGTPSYPIIPLQHPGRISARLILPLARPIPTPGPEGAATWRGLRQAGIDWLGLEADPKTKNLERIYFLPCGVWQPDADTWRTHAPNIAPRALTPEELARPFVWTEGAHLDLLAFTPAPEPLTRAAESAAGGERDLLERVFTPGERRDHLFKIACSARARGLNVGEMVNAANARCVPPLDTIEMATMVNDVMARYPAGHGLNDEGNAMLLADRHRAHLRYCEDLGGPLRFDGTRWRVDDMALPAAASDVAEHLHVLAVGCKDEEAGAFLKKHAIKAQDSKQWSAMQKMAKHRIAIKPESFDAQHWKFVAGNVTLDLAAMIHGAPLAGRCSWVGAHRADDFSTQASTVIFDPAATCPQWEAFLATCWPDPEVRAFMQRFAGYCLTGDTSEQKWLLMYGSGSNGKGVFMRVTQYILGDYQTTAPEGFLVERANGHDAHPTELMTIRGKRAVFQPEIKSGKTWNEARIQTLTGQDTLKARLMGKDFVSFDPTAKLIVSSNDQPTVSSDTHAFYRRLMLLPCLTIITNPDPRLTEKLMAEAPGILNWMLRGTWEWSRMGLAMPQALTNAVTEYRQSEDPIRSFLESADVLIEPGSSADPAELFAAYYRHAKIGGGTNILSQNRFGRLLSLRGFPLAVVGGGKRARIGLRITSGRMI